MQSLVSNKAFYGGCLRQKKPLTVETEGGIVNLYSMRMKCKYTKI
jgi:hypothetical protein